MAVAASKTVMISGPLIFDAIATVHPKCDSFAAQKFKVFFGKTFEDFGCTCDDFSKVLGVCPHQVAS